MSFLQWLDSLTHAPWFVAVDMAFHIIVIGHVIAHICRAGKRLHQWVHVPLRHALWRAAWWRGCGRCHACGPLVANQFGNFDYMVLCPSCGNKRCPKASNHKLACTGSNEPGQAGSVYA